MGVRPLLGIQRKETDVQNTFTVRPLEKGCVDVRAAQVKIVFANEMKSAIRKFLDSCDKCKRGEEHNRQHTELLVAMINYLNSDKAQMTTCEKGHTYVSFSEQPCFKCSKKQDIRQDGNY